MLGELLGRGGMAEVFAGYVMGDHGFQKPVAIKRLLPELAVDKVFVDRLIEEAKLLVGMQHGNIVSVLDLARDGDDVFLVMEFVDGPSLRQLIKARGTRGIPPAIATYVVQTASQGLEFAHSRPGGAIIHADISPSNLLLTTSGEVRVADFGIARREGGGCGIVEGKWAYMAPEQARGEPLDPRSDVFAMGVVLYELLTGAHPFGRQVTHEERDSQPMRVISPRVVKPSLPAGLEAICMKALAHERRDRYPRMQALIDAIVEERFANQYREGASDLAAAIREANPSGAGPQPGTPRTMITDRPVTIMTRSLLREVTPLPGTVNGAPRSRSQSSSDPQARVQPQLPVARQAPPRLESFDEPLSTYERASESRYQQSRSASQSVSRSHHEDPSRARAVAAGEIDDDHDDDDASSHPSGAQTTAIDTEEVARAAAAADPVLGAFEPGTGPAYTPEQVAAAQALLAQQNAARAAAALLQQLPPQLRSSGLPMPQWLPPTPPEPAIDSGYKPRSARPPSGEQLVVAARSHRLLYSVLLAVAILGLVIVVAIKLMPQDEAPPQAAIDEVPGWVNGAPPPKEALEAASGTGAFGAPDPYVRTVAGSEPTIPPDAAVAEATIATIPTIATIATIPTIPTIAPDAGAPAGERVESAGPGDAGVPVTDPTPTTPTTPTSFPTRPTSRSPRPRRARPHRRRPVRRCMQPVPPGLPRGAR